jgi:hypothetical protein
MVGHFHPILPTDDLSSYIEVPENRFSGNFPSTGGRPRSHGEIAAQALGRESSADIAGRSILGTRRSLFRSRS